RKRLPSGDHWRCCLKEASAVRRSGSAASPRPGATAKSAMMNRRAIKHVPIANGRVANEIVAGCRAARFGRSGRARPGRSKNAVKRGENNLVAACFFGDASRHCPRVLAFMGFSRLSPTPAGVAARPYAASVFGRNLKFHFQFRFSMLVASDGKAAAKVRHFSRVGDMMILRGGIEPQKGNFPRRRVNRLMS